ncbi:hypothetical protein BJY04DRAFT_214270 [Aspergillus karnatakaensis]|uniref:RidA family protein n=1 Tax=Aspergillus karnatakaensis TaxID=1810916 RepID=UPI003CCE1B8C
MSLIQTASLPRRYPPRPPQSDITVIPFPPDTPTPTLGLFTTSAQSGVPLPTYNPKTRTWNEATVALPFKEQAATAFAKVREALRLKNIKPKDVTKITVYLDGMLRMSSNKKEQLDAAVRGFMANGAREWRGHWPALTISSGYQLDGSDVAVEVEGVVRWAGPSESGLDQGQGEGNAKGKGRVPQTGEDLPPS